VSRQGQGPQGHDRQARLPGERFLGIAERLFERATLDYVIRPVVADMQEAWARATRAGCAREARRAVIRGHVDLIKVSLMVAIQGGVTSSRLAAWPVILPALIASLGAIWILHGGIGVYEVPAAAAKRQLVYLVVGVAGLGGVAAAPLARLRSFGAVWAILAVALAAAVLFAGESDEGLRRWIALGPLQLQATEFCKPLLILAAASHFTRRDGRRRGLAIFGIMASLTLALMAMQPDFEAVLVLAVTLSSMAFAAGLGRLRVAAIGAFGAALCLWTYAAQQRVHVGRGAQDLHTDAILSLFAHQAGALGACVALGAVGVVIVGTVGVARRTQDRFVRVLVGGVATSLAVQAVAQPVLGEGMMLLSYGGSPLVATFLSLGLVVNAIRNEAASTEQPTEHAAS